MSHGAGRCRPLRYDGSSAAGLQVPLATASKPAASLGTRVVYLSSAKTPVQALRGSLVLREKGREGEGSLSVHLAGDF